MPYILRRLALRARLYRTDIDMRPLVVSVLSASMPVVVVAAGNPITSCTWRISPSPESQAFNVASVVH